MLEQGLRSFFDIWPRYARALGAVLAAPIDETEARARSGMFADAVTFWAISAFFHIVPHYIAWMSDAPQALWFTAQFLEWALALVGTALAFVWAGRLVGGRAGFWSALSATAYLWGAVIPVQAVLLLVCYGLIEALDARVYELGVAIVTGCFDSIDIAEVSAWVFESMSTRPTAFLAAFGLMATVFLALTAIQVVYGIAYLRVLRRLHGLGRWRFVAFLPLGLLLSALALSLAEFFGWILWKANCPPLDLPPA